MDNQPWGCGLHQGAVCSVLAHGRAADVARSLLQNRLRAGLGSCVQGSVKLSALGSPPPQTGGGACHHGRHQMLSEHATGQASSDGLMRSCRTFPVADWQPHSQVRALLMTWWSSRSAWCVAACRATVTLQPGKGAPLRTADLPSRLALNPVLALRAHGAPPWAAADRPGAQGHSSGLSGAPPRGQGRARLGSQQWPAKHSEIDGRVAALPCTWQWH